MTKWMILDYTEGERPVKVVTVNGDRPEDVDEYFDKDGTNQNESEWIMLPNGWTPDQIQYIDTTITECKFSLHVGNIGQIKVSDDLETLLRDYNDWVSRSKNNEGRAGGEDVWITNNIEADIIMEYNKELK